MEEARTRHPGPGLHRNARPGKARVHLFPSGTSGFSGPGSSIAANPVPLPLVLPEHCALRLIPLRCGPDCQVRRPSCSAPHRRQSSSVPSCLGLSSLPGCRLRREGTSPRDRTVAPAPGLCGRHPAQESSACCCSHSLLPSGVLQGTEAFPRCSEGCSSRRPDPRPRVSPTGPCFCQLVPDVFPTPKARRVVGAAHLPAPGEFVEQPHGAAHSA